MRRCTGGSRPNGRCAMGTTSCSTRMPRALSCSTSPPTSASGRTSRRRSRRLPRGARRSTTRGTRSFTTRSGRVSRRASTKGKRPSSGTPTGRGRTMIEVRRTTVAIVFLSCCLGLWLEPGAGAAAAATTALGVSVDADGRLIRDSRPIHAVGVNYFDAFLRTLHRADDTSYDAGFAALGELKIPFARVAACGYWPSEMKLYQSDKAEYFRRLDGVVRSAEKHDVGLILSLFWCWSTIPDLAGEPCDQWGNPDSRT